MSEENIKTTATPTAPVASNTADATKSAPVKTAKAKKKKVVRQVPRANAYVQASYNNTIITLADPNGNVLSWSSSGKVGFKGPKKATPYAASQVAKDAIDKVVDYGIKEVSVFIKGVGGGREGAIRALHTHGLNVVSICDVTPIPHNGCRPPKRRRV